MTVGEALCPLSHANADENITREWAESFEDYVEGYMDEMLSQISGKLIGMKHKFHGRASCDFIAGYQQGLAEAREVVEAVRQSANEWFAPDAQPLRQAGVGPDAGDPKEQVVC